MKKLTFLILLVMFCGIGISGQTKRGSIKKKTTVAKKKHKNVKNKSNKCDWARWKFCCATVRTISREMDEKCWKLCGC